MQALATIKACPGGLPADQQDQPLRGRVLLWLLRTERWLSVPTCDFLSQVGTLSHRSVRH